MAIIVLEAVGPRAEELATEAARITEVPIGFDPDFRCATFDSDELEDAELRELVLAALAALDAGWDAHLRVAD